MIKRTLYFGNPAYLSLTNSQLEIKIPSIEKNQEHTEGFKKIMTNTVPIEDIGIIVLDNQQITISQAVLAELLENNCAIITCNNTHHPVGLLLPLSANTIQNERYRTQLDATEPLKKQLWQQTVVQKIKNQAAVLKAQNIDISFLITLHQNVKSGDSNNCEATAAAFYWQSLSPIISDNSSFRRFREGPAPNHYFNYGYSLLRATMARSIVGAGLLPTLGIHHANRYNAYCLADDLMEPYRPYVDELVLEIIKEHGITEELPKEIKGALLKIPALDVILDGEKSPLMTASHRTAVSIVKCFEGEQRKPLYPEL